MRATHHDGWILHIRHLNVQRFDETRTRCTLSLSLSVLGVVCVKAVLRKVMHSYYSMLRCHVEQAEAGRNSSTSTSIALAFHLIRAHRAECIVRASVSRADDGPALRPFLRERARACECVCENISYALCKRGNSIERLQEVCVHG